MLLPSEQDHSADYRDRKGQVVVPQDGHDFFSRRGAFVICDVDGYILMMKTLNGEGFWELPGGGIDAGETALEAAIRETIEETGIDLSGVSGFEKVQSQKVFLHLPDEDQFWNYDQDYFLIKNSTLKSELFTEVQPSPEDGEMCWFKTQNLKDIPIKHTVVKALVSLGYLE